jgi:hypothetical protein
MEFGIVGGPSAPPSEGGDARGGNPFGAASGGQAAGGLDQRPALGAGQAPAQGQGAGQPGGYAQPGAGGYAAGRNDALPPAAPAPVRQEPRAGAAYCPIHGEMDPTWTRCPQCLKEGRDGRLLTPSAGLPRRDAAEAEARLAQPLEDIARPQPPSAGFPAAQSAPAPAGSDPMAQAPVGPPPQPMEQSPVGSPAQPAAEPRQPAAQSPYVLEPASPAAQSPYVIEPAAPPAAQQPAYMPQPEMPAPPREQAAPPPAAHVAREPEAPPPPQPITAGDQPASSVGRTVVIRRVPRVLAYLIEKEGEQIGRPFQLESDVSDIGRDPRNHLVVSDRLVSAFHARVERAPDGGFIVRDRGSTNGTRVNGQTLTEPHPIGEDDEVSVGNTTLVLKVVK